MFDKMMPMFKISLSSDLASRMSLIISGPQSKAMVFNLQTEPEEEQELNQQIQ